MDDPNITMEKYIRLEEEKAQMQVFDNTLMSDAALPCEPTVSPPNENKIDFRISLDESDDEDYTVIFDENLFSYKLISVNDLKIDTENDNAIVYNDDLTSKPDLEIEPPISSERINKFETSLSEYDEEEQNTLRFSDSFLPEVVFPNDPKMIKDSDDNI
ncbi:hypothetical protein Tco_0959812, partial [Tanacetum coccineum]